MLSIVSFDVCGTLMDRYYFDYMYNEAIPILYAEKKQIDLDEAKAYVLKEYDNIGSRDIRWYLPEFWFQYLSLDEDPIKVFQAHTGKIKFYPEVPSVLKDLSQKYVLIVASGIPKPYIEVALGSYLSFFKRVFSNVSDLKQVSKSAGFYDMICKSMKIEPSSIVHIGDNWKTDYIIPRKIGITSYFVDRNNEKNGKFIVKNLKEFEGQLI